ncbi:Satratoxin biosynthesis SC1 cluster protein 4 [Apiospora arundinis]|uniref:Satratoxin biosynthesis SC1 cluster protein 4 n=1 Tax=Apiospora arundinis TaxID=335852 RepID=A0ABR2HLZ1_9PEZI
MAWTWNVDDEFPDNGANLAAMAVVFSTASLLSVLSRAYVRFYLLKAVGAAIEDDWAIIIAWVGA